MKIYGRRLKLLRLRKFMSTHKLADLLNTCCVAVIRYEQGKRSPRDATIKKLAEILSVEPGSLTGILTLDERCELKRLEGMQTPSAGFGERLKSLRRARNLSQRRLAKLAGVLCDTIGRLERSQYLPHLSTVRKLADALQVRPETLCGLHQTKRRKKS